MAKLGTTSMRALLSIDALKSFYALTKPRVCALIVFTAIIGMFLATPGIVPLDILFFASIGIAFVSGAAAAFNCLIEEKIDAMMARTKARPLPLGQVSQKETIIFSSVLGGLGLYLLYVFVNPLTAWLTLLTFFAYAVIYTVFLKPATPMNIVIGGASGAMPPVLGWAAVTNQVTPESLILFLIIFCWTPPHFWALSLYRSDDYKAAGVPMMPLVHGRYETKKQILLYSIVLCPLGVAPFWLGTLGAVYGATSAILGVLFIGAAWRVMKNDSEKNCKQLFGFSIFYLFFLFFAMIVDRCVNFNPIL